MKLKSTFNLTTFLIGLFLVFSVTTVQAQDVYVVKKGDTLFGVARSHNLTLDQIKKLNQIDGNDISIGQRLIIRVENVVQETSGLTENSISGVHVVEAGETLYSIAARYNTSVDTLMILNAVDSVYLEPSQQLSLPERFSEKTHPVIRGESLSRISRKYKVSVSEIKRANGLNSNNISVGQKLTIPIHGVAEIGPRGSLGNVIESGIVTVYPIMFAGRLTASGERYDSYELTVSHRTLPFDTILLLTNSVTGRSVFARVNDRGPLEDALIMDVSGEILRQLEISIKEKHQIEIRLVQ